MSVTRAIIIGLGLLFVGFGLRTLLGIIKLIRACKETTEGVLMDYKEALNSSSSSDSPPSTEYAPIFKYIVNGNEYIQVPSNHISRFVRLVAGAKTTIFYNPDSPEQCYARGHNKNFLLVILGIICLITGIPIIAYGLGNLATFN